MIRPALARRLQRWREVAAAAAALALGLWVATRGGWILGPFGLGIAALAAGSVLLALRRMRFRADPGAAGLVELDEGHLRYLHPTAGGEISLNDLAELRLLRLRGRPVWALTDMSGRRLLVPLQAAGAEALFDAFAALPGLSSADLVAALGRASPAPAAPSPAPSPAPTAAPAAAPTAAPPPAIALENRPVWSRRGAALRRL